MTLQKNLNFWTALNFDEKREKIKALIERFFKPSKKSKQGIVQIDENLPEWKEQTLMDFAQWIRDLPDSPPKVDGVTMDSCDLYTLLSEFSGLRQEIRLQNREQHRTIRSLEEIKQGTEQSVHTITSLSDSCFETLQKMQDIADDLKNVEETQRAAIEKQSVLPFLDLRDALVRGLSAARQVSSTKGLFVRPPKEISGVIDGYEMSIRRFDRALDAFGIHPVDAVGKPFDPKIMRAVGTREVPGKEKGIVVEEQFCGYTMGSDIIRTSEVIVTS